MRSRVVVISNLRGKGMEVFRNAEWGFTFSRFFDTLFLEM